MNNPELLSPAGDLEKLKFAVHYGADAVYIGGGEFGMREAAKNFDAAEMEKGVNFAHERGKKVYVTVNTMPREDEISRLPEYLSELRDIGVDAFIVADIGVLGLCKKCAPDVPIHISTQANIVNHLAANMWHDLGADRVVLARELSLAEIKEIRKKTPSDLEIETFVHGAMCMSYSGRCYISDYMTGRDANRGKCAQPCRWKYRLVEELRPNEYFPVFEDDDGAYIMNSKDLCMIDHIPELIEAGIGSFKIEGRVKTAYYTAVVTNAYRRAIDLYLKDPLSYKLPPQIKDEVMKVSHREYYTGFFFGEGGGQYCKDSRYIRDFDVCAVVESCDEDGNAVMAQKNKMKVGDKVELLEPFSDAISFEITEMKDSDGISIDEAPHPHMTVKMRLPKSAGDMAIIRKEN